VTTGRTKSLASFNLSSRHLEPQIYRENSKRS
jgi:hypothetical protein